MLSPTRSFARSESRSGAKVIDPERLASLEESLAEVVRSLGTQSEPEPSMDQDAPATASSDEQEIPPAA